MSDAKRMLYLGSDSEFYKELSSYVLNFGIGDITVENSNYAKGGLVKLISNSKPQIIYIDLTLIEDLTDMIHEVIYIKRNSAMKGILFVAVFPDIASMDAKRSLLTAGFQLFFIKGSESVSLFRDSFYIAFDSISDFPAYARARKIDKNISMGICSSLYSISGNEFIMETDIDIPDETLVMKLPLFPDLTCKEFKIKNKTNFAFHYPMTTTYHMELPLADAWSEVTSDILLPDTFETWKELNSAMLRFEPVFIKVISTDLNIFQEIFEQYDPFLFHVSFNERLSLESFKEEMEYKKPPLIFYELENEESGSLEQLGEMTAFLSTTMDQLPIVICTNTPSKSQAIQKLLNFPNIICYDKPLSSSLYSNIIRSFLEKRKNEGDQQYIFEPSAIGRSFDVKFDVQLTSLTEHEITFYSSANLPMYTILHFNLPVEFIATVIPPIYEIPQRAESQQYMAFINGIDEGGLALLRKFINQIIYSPPLDYSEKSIAQVVKSMNIEKREEISVPQAVINLKKETKNETHSKAALIPPRFKGKSKL